MWKLNLFFALLSSIILLPSGTGQGTIVDNAPITFQLYQHEFQSGPNASVYEVDRAAVTASSPTWFGSLRVGNILITTGPDINLTMLGRIEGLVTYTGLTVPSGILFLVFRFTEGEYNGSSINLLGRKQVTSTSDEVPIVGGTGAFLTARGYTLSSTYSYDPALDYTVMISMFTPTRGRNPLLSLMIAK